MRYDILLLVIFFVLVFPISLKVKFKINLIRNSGLVMVYLFHIFPIFFQRFEIDNGVIKLIKSPNKIHKIKLSFKREDVKKFNNSFSIVLNSQIIKTLDINTIFGIKNSPSIVAYVSGIYNVILSNFLSINIAKGNILNSQSSLKTNFNHTFIKTYIETKIRFSLLNVLNIFLQIKMGVKT